MGWNDVIVVFQWVKAILSIEGDMEVDYSWDTCMDWISKSNWLIVGEKASGDVLLSRSVVNEMKTSGVGVKRSIRTGVVSAVGTAVGGVPERRKSQATARKINRVRERSIFFMYSPLRIGLIIFVGNKKLPRRWRSLLLVKWIGSSNFYKDRMVASNPENTMDMSNPFAPLTRW